MTSVDILVEGRLDEAVAKRIFKEASHSVQTTFGMKGCNYVLEKIAGFSSATRWNYLLAMIDAMDCREQCPPEILRKYLQYPGDRTMFRVVSREIESWLLADRHTIAEYFQIPPAKIPGDPESLEDPKQTLIGLARTSRMKTIREGLVPMPNSTASEGRLYTPMMVKYVASLWRPEMARAIAPSLGRCLRKLESIR